MVKERALKYFRGKEKYNCAQAIIAAFYEKCGLEKEQITEKIEHFKGMGHGKAENGLCGAVYAAKRLINNKEKEALFEAEFLKSSPSNKCMDILHSKVTDCRQAVALSCYFKKLSTHKTIIN